MNAVLEKLLLDTASDEALSVDEFIADIRQNPDDWYAFRRAELIKLIDGVLTEVASLTDTSMVPTGPSLEELKIHFGLINVASAPEEQPIDWHGFNSN